MIRRVPGVALSYRRGPWGIVAALGKGCRRFRCACAPGYAAGAWPAGGGRMARWRLPDAIRVTAVELVRTVGPYGKEMLWIPGTPSPGRDSPVHLQPEPGIPLEQALLTCVSMLSVDITAWYAAMRIAGW